MAIKDEFYIGWAEKSPRGHAKKTRTFVLIVGLAIIIFSAAWVFTQRGFADSTFELGTLSTVEGHLQMKPVPMLKVNQNGKTHSILLIGFGKMGVENVLSAIENAEDESLEGKNIRLEGTLIYHNGKTLLELTKGDKAYKGPGEERMAISVSKKLLGDQSLKGEILDPKCALGVMKPGFGKPHRSCAVRCLSGGIPPILKLTAKNGEVNYCILLGEEGDKINEELLPFVADQVRICGRLEEQDDWLVFYKDEESEVLRLAPFWMNDNIPMCN